MPEISHPVTERDTDRPVHRSTRYGMLVQVRWRVQRAVSTLTCPYKRRILKLLLLLRLCGRRAILLIRMARACLRRRLDHGEEARLITTTSLSSKVDGCIEWQRARHLEAGSRSVFSSSHHDSVRVSEGSLRTTQEGRSAPSPLPLLPE